MLSGELLSYKAQISSIVAIYSSAVEYNMDGIFNSSRDQQTRISQTKSSNNTYGRLTKGFARGVYWTLDLSMFNILCSSS